MRAEMGPHYWKGGEIKAIKTLIIPCFIFFGVFLHSKHALKFYYFPSQLSISSIVLKHMNFRETSAILQIWLSSILITTFKPMHFNN